MLTIRDAQMTAFREAAVARFKVKIAALLGASWPERRDVLGRARFDAMIGDGVDRAFTYHITREYDVARYLNVMLALGNDFAARMAWAGTILRDPDKPPEERVSLLVAATRRQFGVEGEMKG